jgi:hypothetical protein
VVAAQRKERSVDDERESGLGHADRFPPEQEDPGGEAERGTDGLRTDADAAPELQHDRRSAGAAAPDVEARPDR